MPWVKGQSGNPHGRPKKGKTITEIIEKYGRKRIETDKGRMLRLDALALKMWDLALEGDIAAQKYICDRLEGRPKQSVETNAPLIGQLADLWATIGSDADAEPETTGDPE